MHSHSDHTIAVYYEHPTWFAPLFRELDRRALPHVRIDATRHAYDPAGDAPSYALVVNRASPSAYLRGNRTALFATLGWLLHLERRGVPVVNGARVYAIEISKAAQLELLRALGLPFPPSRVLNDPSQAVPAARALRYPVVVKPNVGGSGGGIVLFETEAELAHVAAHDGLDLGPDMTALVQEYIPPADGKITRVETLDGSFLYAINVYPGTSFNLCPADACRTADGRTLVRGAVEPETPDTGMRVEPAPAPPGRIVRAVERIAAAAGLDVGGIEYVTDARDGRTYFYDVNALSNFVADAPAVLGFDPLDRFVDYLERRAHLPRAVERHPVVR